MAIINDNFSSVPSCLKHIDEPSRLGPLHPSSFPHLSFRPYPLSGGPSSADSSRNVPRSQPRHWKYHSNSTVTATIKPHENRYPYFQFNSGMFKIETSELKFIP